MSGSFKLVVVGAGIAGLEVATRLGERLGRRGRATVTLVDRGLSHVWKPMLHMFAAGTASPDREKVGLLVHARRHGFTFRPGSLAGVDRAGRTVLLGPFDDGLGEKAGVASRTVDYDGLVIAIGSRSNDFGTPGVAEHCISIDNLDEAVLFQRHLSRAVFEAAENRRSLDVAIVGGGATGVELAAEIKRALNLIVRYDASAAGVSLNLTLVESGPRLLAAFPEQISAAATQTLRTLGVRVMTGAEVVGADANGFVIKNDGRVDASLLVWAAGVRAPAILGDLDGLERSRTGQLIVTPTMQTTHDDAIFALGDCARLTDADGKPVPATAQAARQEALHFARHAGAWMEGRAMPPFRYRDKGSVVSLADFNGWGTLGRYTFGGGALKGLSARVAHDMLYRQHQLELHGPMRTPLIWLSDGLERAIGAPVRLD